MYRQKMSVTFDPGLVLSGSWEVWLDTNMSPTDFKNSKNRSRK